VPILADVECGHVQPHLALVQGAVTTVVHDGDTHAVSQRLV